MYVARGTPGSRHFANAGIVRVPFVEVLLLLLQRVRLVRNLVALDDAAAGRHAQVARQLGVVVLDVPGRRVQRLPDPAEIGLALRRPRHLIASRTRRRARRQPAVRAVAAGPAVRAAGGVAWPPANVNAVDDDDAAPATSVSLPSASHGDGP